MAEVNFPNPWGSGKEIQSESDMEFIGQYLPDLDPSLINDFESYYEILKKFNEKINLISKASIKKVALLHFADSVLGLRKISKDLSPNSSSPMYDFGSGNGFPGLISALLDRDRPHILVEKDQRKLEFLKFLSKELRLSNVEFWGEQASQIKPQAVSLAVSRGMAPLNRITVLLRRVFAPNGRLYLFKGENWVTEISDCLPQIFDAWEIRLKGSYKLPARGDVHSIVECVRLG